MSDLLRVYNDFLAGLRLRHFRPSEVTSYATAIRNGVRNDLPPEELWPNIVPTLWVIDHLRASLGFPIVLTSTYRSPEYNEAVGGAENSYHMRNMACDFHVAAHAPERIGHILKTWRADGVFTGGIGTYPTFVHLDTRSRNADW